MAFYFLVSIEKFYLLEEKTKFLQQSVALIYNEFVIFQNLQSSEDK